VAPQAAVEHLPLGVAPAGRRFERRALGPVLAVARLVPKKGLDTLVEACAVALARDDGIRAEIVGGGPLLDELRELANARGITDRVVFHGALAPDEVAEAYARCSVVVAPCRVGPDGDRDGLPTVLLEAMSRGIPVIATDALGIPELIEDGRNGLLVPPDDPGALADAILRLRSDASLAERLGTAGMRTVEGSYALAERSAALRGWLETCARQGERPRA
jgi:glycosyltransferase involved in cell wall biosynthesis